ncbi:MAG TPA: type II restriction endonuclease [Rhizomicrobium sp.]
MTDPDPLGALIEAWRSDAGGTYRTWFLWEERVKNFRSIRRGLQQVVSLISDGTFGNAYRGSALETVVGSIAEQRQIFRGADHPFLWKPKLRIPDIYESVENQKAFGALLDTCLCCDGERQIIEAIHAIDAKAIKGLGPAVANLLYFLHPTFVPPFNTAIVKGYNAITGSKVKLGRWQEFLAMREGMLRLNGAYRQLLSNDLGAIGGFLFDVGNGRYVPPPLNDEPAAMAAWRAELDRARAEAANANAALVKAASDDHTHTKVQGWLRDLGLALGFHVWIAANDQNRNYNGDKLGKGCIDDLPVRGAGMGAVRLIDVIWLEKTSGAFVAAFEVEHTTSIYSGIVRLLDLALGEECRSLQGLFLVAPDDREQEVREQLRRPAFSRVADLKVRYLPYGELDANRNAIVRFGQGMKPIEAISRLLG